MQESRPGYPGRPVFLPVYVIVPIPRTLRLTSVLRIVAMLPYSQSFPVYPDNARRAWATVTASVSFIFADSLSLFQNKSDSLLSGHPVSMSGIQIYWPLIYFPITALIQLSLP